jgi:hypothetical protein
MQEYCEKLKNPYINANDLMKLTKELTCNKDIKNINALCRLWLSEGIPYAFKDHPCYYEYLREYIAQEIGIHPKELTLVGSARIGTSFTSKPCGKEFNEGSDLDWTAISNDLFDLCKKDFIKWANDFKGGLIEPNNSQKKYWPSNYELALKVERSGFIDPKNVPAKPDLYKTTSHILNSMYKATLKYNDIMPIKIKYSSVRVYRSWKDFMDRLSLNLRHIAKDTKEMPKLGILFNQQNQQ